MKNKSLPTKQQAAWQDMEMGMFAHFGINTFNDEEWSDGTLEKESFFPSDLDTYQWVKTAKDAGFKYFLLTAKHHDGFCLWQTKTTDYSVKSIKWKDGCGDVVKECSDACRKLGIKFGIYISPWDRHEKCYPDVDAYNKFYLTQLEELMTGYGDIFEVWFDGAGSENRKYDWDAIISKVHEHQPDAMIFNMGTPTIRWVGNEAGIAPYPCPNSAKGARASMFTGDMLAWSDKTPSWVPAECDTTIRSGKWFYHPNDEKSLKSLDELKYVYYNSVGHGANLLLNISPDTSGRFADADIKRVMEFGNFVRNIYKNKIVEYEIFQDEFEIDLGEFTPISNIVIMEDIMFGENVKAFEVHALICGGWIKIIDGKTIGHKKIDCVCGVKASKLKFIVTEKTDDVKIKSFAVYV